MSIGAMAAVVAWSPAWCDAGAEVERALSVRPALAAAPTAEAIPRVPKLAVVDPGAVTSNACTGCREPQGGARPLFPALAPGDSYEVRILKDAVSGFTLRLSDGDGASSPDERLRIRISRQRIGISWQRSF